MYLTKLPINPARRDARRLLASPQAMHAAVMAAFADPPKADGEGPRVLWRLDTVDGRRTTLYVSSPVEPDLTHVVEQAGWPTTETWRTRSTVAFLQSLAEGQTWVFRLTANPVHAVALKEGEPSRRLGHVTVAQQEKWLLDRMERNGFRVRKAVEGGSWDLVVRDRRRRTFKRGRGTVTLDVATYDGVLEVVDADALRRVLVRGLGSAKGYGCGLMTLAPVPGGG